MNSVLISILQNLAEYINNLDLFNSLEFYYDPGEINATNISTPAICFKVGYADDNAELKEISYDCLTTYRNIEIRIITDNRLKGELSDEIYHAEEVLRRALNNIHTLDIHPSFNNIKYVGTDPIKYIIFQDFRQNFKDEYFCNTLVMKYEIEYSL